MVGGNFNFFICLLLTLQNILESRNHNFMSNVQDKDGKKEMLCLRELALLSLCTQDDMEQFLKKYFKSLSEVRMGQRLQHFTFYKPKPDYTHLKDDLNSVYEIQIAEVFQGQIGV